MKVHSAARRKCALKILMFGLSVVVLLIGGCDASDEELSLTPTQGVSPSEQAPTSTPAQKALSTPVPPRAAGAQVHWEPAGFSAGGLFLQIAVDPVETNVLYVGADVSGLYKSTDYGSSWTSVNAGLGSREIASLAIDPSDHRSLWVGTPMGLYNSGDGGASWSLVNAEIHCFKHVNYGGISISQDGRNILVASHDLGREADDLEKSDFSGKLYHSSDGGLTWTVVRQFPGQGIPSVAYDPYAPDRAFLLVARQGILRSTDGGRSWEDFSDGLPSNRNWKNLNVGQSVIYAAAAPTEPYKSGKDAASWESIRSDIPETEEGGSLADPIVVSPAGDDVVYLGQDGWPHVFYKSIDGGSSWSGVEVPDSYRVDAFHAPYQEWVDPWQAVFAIAVDPQDPDRIYYTTWWGVWRSKDGGASWEETVVGTQNTCCTGVAFAGDALLASHMDLGVLRSLDLGATWLTGFPRQGQDRDFGDLHAWGIERGADGKVYVGLSTDKGPRIYRSDDDGASWQEKSAGLPKRGDDDIFLVSIAADPNDPGTLYLAVDSLMRRGLFRTTDYGETWKRLPNAPGSEGSGEGVLIKCLEVDPTDSDRIYAGLYWDGLWYSEDGGKRWHLAQGDGVDLAENSVQEIVALEDGTVYAAYDDGLYRSVDRGHTFSRAFPDLPRLGEETIEYVSAIALNPADADEIFVSTAKTYPIWFNRGSVWHTEDGGGEWTEITGDLPVKNVVDLVYRDGYLYAATWCANVYRTDISEDR